jgi:hypothetical protein
LTFLSQMVCAGVITEDQKDRVEASTDMWFLCHVKTGDLQFFRCSFGLKTGDFLSTIICVYLHLVLFRAIYYYQVAVWFIGPYFRRHIMLIVCTTSQYKSTPRHTVNSFVTS